MCRVDTVTPPAGHTSRAPEIADAERILDLVVAYNTPIIGYGDFTLDDVRDELTEPGFDRATDGWLVFDPQDALVGYGWAMGQRGDGDIVDVESIALDAQVGRWLLDRALERATGIGRSRGLDQVTVDKTIYRGDEAMTGLATRLGFQQAATFHRMRIDHSGPVPMPEPPPGVLVHEGAYDDAIRRAAHHVSMSSFAEHFGYTDTPYEQWLETHEARSVFDWSQLTVVEADGEPVAICECNDAFVEDENCGYVMRIGVLKQARGHGLAKYLLRRAFAADAAAGRTGTILHVDTNNTTPALGLYESVGMRPSLVLDVWRRRL
jgi:ribosomal protein S18 acetylase RimI-like enzyme